MLLAGVTLQVGSLAADGVEAFEQVVGARLEYSLTSSVKI